MKNKRLSFLILLCLGLIFQMKAVQWNVTDATSFGTAWSGYAAGDTIVMASGNYDLSGSTRSISKTVFILASPTATTKPVVKVQFNYTGNASFYMNGIEAYYDAEGAASPTGAYMIDTRNVGSYTMETISLVNCKIHGYGRDLLRADNSSNIPTITNLIMDNCIVYDMGRNSVGYPVFGVKYGKITNATITNSTFYNSPNGLWLSQVTATPVTFRMEKCTLVKTTSASSTDIISASPNPGSNYTIKDCIISDSYDATSTHMKLTLGSNGTTHLGYLINTILANNFGTTKVSGTLTTNTEVATTTFSADFPTLVIQTTPNTITGIGDPRWTLNPVISQPAYLSTTIYPTGAGSIAASPSKSVYAIGDNVTLTASRNFGYQFKEWRDANSDAVVSTANPYTVTLNSDVSLKAVFSQINTYSLAINTQGGAPAYMVNVSPAGTVVGGQTMYEEGTNITLTANNNNIYTFTNWLTGETSSTLTIPMNQNQNITAAYSAVDYIVGWDFYKSGASGRPADFYSTSDNQTSTLILRKDDGTTGSWLDKSIVAGAGYGSPARGAAVNWQAFANKYYYQTSFSAKDFTDVKVSAGMLYSYNAYSVQNCQYSLDGTNFTQLGTYTLSTGNAWVDQTFSLPADANHADKVYIRWIPDYTSSVVGATSANDGTAISNIYVTAKAAVYNDGVAPVLSSSVPVASATNASTTGKVVLTFDEKVMLTSGYVVANLGGKQLTPAVSGKTITFSYSGLDYNTPYTFDLPANSVSDLAGNTLTSAVSIAFTTMTRPTVTKKLFDFVVGVDGDFKAAITAATAASASGNRFRIFFPNGEYNIGANTGNANQMTSIALPNVSYVGQSSDGVVLYNQNTTEGIGVTATMYFTNTASNLYLQDLTLKNKDYRSGTSSIGRCVALWDQGSKNIYKNVNLLSNQDTYYSGSGRLYFEGGSIHGTVDFICGGGDVFFNECLLYLENRSGNCITAPATSSSWGYVFNNCTIDGFSINNGSYYLGRPWQNSPKSVYINTKMNQLPTAAGWTEMGVVPGLFAEYNSTTSGGATVDLSTRKTSYTYNGVTTQAPSPILTAEQAAQYTVENVLGGTDTWQPKLYTDAAATPVISGSGSSISWADNNYVLCWAIFKDGVFVTFTTTNSYSIPSSVVSGTYTVRAANEMGGLGTISNAYQYSSVATGSMNASEQTVVAYSKDGVLHLSNLPAPCKVEIYSINGKQIVSKNITTSSATLPMSENNAIIRVISTNATCILKVTNR